MEKEKAPQWTRWEEFEQKEDESIDLDHSLSLRIWESRGRSHWLRELIVVGEGLWNLPYYFLNMVEMKLRRRKNKGPDVAKSLTLFSMRPLKANRLSILTSCCGTCEYGRFNHWTKKDGSGGLFHSTKPLLGLVHSTETDILSFKLGSSKPQINTHWFFMGLVYGTNAIEVTS